MEKEVSKMNKWCDRAWIKFGLLITAIMMIAIFINWREWPLELKLLGAFSALIPIHVVEEWVFPGGFHYQYNYMMKSDELDRYPMCRKSDMFTNLIVTIIYAVLTFYYAAVGYVPTYWILATVIFSYIEVVAHTAFGCMMYKRFHKAGKTTIYGPGSLTAYCCFLVIGVLGSYCLTDRTLSGQDWAIGLGILLGLLIVSIIIPEGLIKRKGNEYYFKSAGYYERFLNK